MRILFCGTPLFALPSLEALIAGPDEVVGILSQPDRPQGRGRARVAAPVARRGASAGIPVHTPERLDDPALLAGVRETRLDLIVTCAYGKILPRSLLDLPPMGALNVHASLLPRHRGAAPVARAILEGDSWTGITIFRLDAGMDTGPILLQAAERIAPDDTTGSLAERLSRIGARTLLEACRQVRAGGAAAQPQDEALATYAPRIRKEEGRLLWRRPADQLERFVRAMEPWPSAQTVFRGEPAQICRAAVIDLLPREAPPGTLLSCDPAPVAAAGPGAVRIERIRPAGRKEMDGDQWARGARVSAGERFC